MGASSDVMRFALTFLTLGVLVMLGLQNSDGGLRQSAKNKVETEGDDWIGFWSFCISSAHGAVLTNAYIPVNLKLGTGVCLAFDGDLMRRVNQTNSTVAVNFCLGSMAKLENTSLLVYWEDYKYLMGCRALTLIAIMIAVVAFTIIEIAESNRCVMTIAVVLVIVCLTCEGVVVILTIVVWYNNEKEFALAWPWIMPMVGSGLLCALIILLCCMCRKAEKGSNDSGSGEKDRGNCLRWVFVVLFLPALAFQFVIHASEGAKGSRKDGEYHARLGLWLYCLDRRSEVAIGSGATLRAFHSNNMCLQMGTDIPKEIVNYTLLSVAVWFVFIAHLSTFGGLFLAVYPKYVEKYRTRKCLFILRLIDCLVMAAAFTVAVALCTAAVPDQWRMGFAFICAWVAMAVMWAIVFLSAVQCGCMKNLLGEAPEAEEELEQKKQETAKLNQQPDHRPARPPPPIAERDEREEPERKPAPEPVREYRAPSDEAPKEERRDAVPKDEREERPRSEKRESRASRAKNTRFSIQEDGKTGDAGAAAVTSPSGRRSSRVRRSTSRALPGREETTAAAAAPVEAEPEAEPAPPTPPPAAVPPTATQPEDNLGADDKQDFKDGDTVDSGESPPDTDKDRRR